MVNDGRLIIFEGIDHVGKSTICEEVYKKLCKQGFQCSKYSFPGKKDGTLGKLVYDIHHDRDGILAGILEIKSYDIDPLSLQILHIAAHIDLINKSIIPDVKAGKIVLLDRSWWSTFAYGLANGLPEQTLKDIIRPELCLLTQITKCVFVYVSRAERENDYSDIKTKAILSSYDKLCKNEYINTIKIANDIDIEFAINTAYDVAVSK